MFLLRRSIAVSFTVDVDGGLSNNWHQLSQAEIIVTHNSSPNYHCISQAPSYVCVNITLMKLMVYNFTYKFNFYDCSIKLSTSVIVIVNNQLTTIKKRRLLDDKQF